MRNEKLGDGNDLRPTPPEEQKALTTVSVETVDLDITTMGGGLPPAAPSAPAQ